MKKPGLPTLATLLALSITVPLQADTQAPADGWEHIDLADGIHVWKHEQPGQIIPGFRGQVVIGADLATVTRAVEDYRFHTEWMHRCAESTVLEQLSAHESIMYNRTDSPWPVSDRDVVVKTNKRVSPDGTQIELSFRNVKYGKKPQIDGVVRMPKLVGHYQLTRVAASKTKVEYQVEANPGGSLPDWIVKRVAKEMPYETLSRLRERVLEKR